MAWMRRHHTLHCCLAHYTVDSVHHILIMGGVDVVECDLVLAWRDLSKQVVLASERSRRDRDYWHRRRCRGGEVK